METTNQITIRPYDKSTDESFVFKTWMDELRDGCWLYKKIDYIIFYKNYRKIIGQIIAQPNTTVSICCFEEDPDVILGYSVYQPRTLHWVYVKYAWRRFKIAKRLIPEGIETITHLTNMAHYIRPKKTVFNPFLEESIS